MSGGQELRVDPGVLRSAAGGFRGAAADIAGLGVDALLGDAAAGMPSLATGSACRSAQTSMADQMKAAADDSREFAGSLDKAATDYETTDRAGQNTIRSNPLAN